MASFDTVNYSLRPNKAIQRQLVFDGLDLLDRSLPLSQSLYIGFGSIWFTDFILAHRRLGITDMISIENKAIGAARARFNAPFKTVRVEEGDSTAVLQAIADDEKNCLSSWIVWLDYDRGLTPDNLVDIATVITHAPQNSVLVLTINASAGSYGKRASGRESYVRNLLGDAVSEEVTSLAFENGTIATTLLQTIQAYIANQAIQLGRPGGYQPAFSIEYRDGSPMITIGGILSAPAARPAIRAVLADPAWPGRPQAPVAAPPLTMREISALQRLLPAEKPVTRAMLRRAGFDLEEEQLSTFCEHYKRYPAFMQIVT